MQNPGVLSANHSDRNTFMLDETASFETSPRFDSQPSLLCVGDVVLGIDGGSSHHTDPGSKLDVFRIAEGDPDINVRIEVEESLKPWSGEPAFDSGAVWKVFHERDQLVFDFASDALGCDPYKRMQTRNFVSAQIILNGDLLPDHAWPLEYPADELLITNYLAHYGLGVEVHGCGLIDQEREGFLFLGHSGAGKSTTTRLWKSVRDPEILSDDRIILRLHEGELWMYGTPWHGEAAFASAEKAKLNRIFILQHGPDNEVTALSPARAAGELFARCFPPFHSAHGLQNTVEFLERVVSTVPCYEFQFVPDDGAVEIALNFHD